MRAIVALTVVPVVMLATSVLTGCGDSGGDTVVGVRVVCDFAQRETGGRFTMQPMSGPVCNGTEGFVNKRHEVTVRTPSGDIYTVEYDGERTVEVGDEWP